VVKSVIILSFGSPKSPEQFTSLSLTLDTI
jgi:hypothetical protein